MAECENYRAAASESTKLKLERVYKDREFEIISDFEEKLRQKDMALSRLEYTKGSLKY